MNTYKQTPTGRYRIEVITEALAVAIDHYDYEGNYDRAAELQLLLDEMKAGK